MSGLIGLIVSLIVLGLLFYAVIWFLDWIALPDPFNKVIKVIVGLVVFLIIISILLGGSPGVGQAPWFNSGHGAWFNWR